ncbi:hypothetical protein ABTW72_01525 [Micromonospora sp. NPDC127501]|uniref:hypothetical protein n=1 Tax=Micromonospora sp. NPDC127501 TaxID=3154872 RepID=UPI00332DE8F2
MRDLHPHDDPEEIVSMKMTPPLRKALVDVYLGNLLEAIGRYDSATSADAGNLVAASVGDGGREQFDLIAL